MFWPHLLPCSTYSLIPHSCTASYLLLAFYPLQLHIPRPLLLILFTENTWYPEPLIPWLLCTLSNFLAPYSLYSLSLDPLSPASYIPNTSYPLNILHWSPLIPCAHALYCNVTFNPCPHCPPKIFTFAASLSLYPLIPLFTDPSYYPNSLL